MARILDQQVGDVATHLAPDGGVNGDDDAFTEQEELRGSRALWRAVITQALMDAGSESRKPEARYDRAQAVAWLSGKSKDFQTVCSLAEMDPDYVRRQAKEAIRRGCSWRAPVVASRRMLAKKVPQKFCSKTKVVSRSEVQEIKSAEIVPIATGVRLENIS